LTLLTGAVKNTFGCVPGFHKSALHLKYPRPGAMSRAIVDVFSLVRPWLNIMDAVESMDGNGPSSGRVIATGLLGASRDAVALDAVFAALAGVAPAGAPVISEAGKRRLGEYKLERIAILGGSLGDFVIRGFEVPSNWAFKFIPGVLTCALTRFLWVRPAILDGLCTGCRVCADMCPAGAISFEDGSGRVDPARCGSCLCCHEVCPEGAVELGMSRLAKLIS
jgi:ferredoxin